MPSVALAHGPSSPGAGPSSTSHPDSHHPKTFKRLRSSLEQTIRNATRSRAPDPAQIEITHSRRRLIPSDSTEDSANSSGRARRSDDAPDKGKQRASAEPAEEKRGVLRRLESKVGLKRLQSNRDFAQSPEPEPQPFPSTPTKLDKEKEKAKTKLKDKVKQKERENNDTARALSPSPRSGWTHAFLPPTLSQASISSPALHQASQAIPSPRSRPAEQVNRENGGALVSPSRDRDARVITGPTVLTPKRDRDREREQNVAYVPRAPSPSRRSSSRPVRSALTSPSTPALISPPSPTPSPSASRVRPRPPPLRSVSASTSQQPLPSPTHTPNLSPSSSPPSPTPLKPRARSPTNPSQLTASRPPLSPSAGLRLKMGSASATHLPLDATVGGKERHDRMERAADKEKEKAKYNEKKRRPYVETETTTTTPAVGRTTPTSSVPGPASRDDSPARQGAQPVLLQHHQRHKASASATSLSLSQQPTSQNQNDRTERQRHNQRLLPSSPSPTPTGTQPTQVTQPSPFRDTLRHATSLLVRELAGPRPRTTAAVPPSPSLLLSHSSIPMTPSQSSSSTSPSHGTGLTGEIWEECEVRLRALVRAERVWGRSGGRFGTSSTSINNMQNGSSVSINTLSNGNGNAVVGGTSGGGLSGAGEERERRVFAEAVRDGYVLCQLTNKLRPGTIVRVDVRDDGFVRTSNVTKFLAAATTLGVPANEIFRRDDMIECTPEGLHRVSRTIIAVVRIAGEADGPTAGKYLHGHGNGRSQASNSPYGTRSSASSSTPNLSSSAQQRSTSPSLAKKRWSPPTPGLPTVRSNSPAQDSSSISGKDKGKTPPIPIAPQKSQNVIPTAEDESALTTDSEDSDGKEQFFDLDPVPEIGPVPMPRLPRRKYSNSDAVVTASRISVTSASSQTTDTTFSSLLAPGGSSATGERSTKYGTMRTVTTEATSFAPSDAPSFTRTEASSVSASLAHADESAQRRLGSLDNGPGGHVLKAAFPMRERRPSETAVVDLSRVAEEVDEGSGASSNGVGNVDTQEDRRKATPIQLGKGKWPDDFINAFQAQPQGIRKRAEDEQQFAPRSGLSSSPPRKLAIVGRTNESVESLQQFPARRPTHRPRHSVDAPGLLPKEVIMLRDRDQSPNQDSLPPNSRVLPRRNSSRTGGQRNGMYIPRSNSESPTPDTTAPVPFPRTSSGEHPGSGSGSGSGGSPDAMVSGLPSRFHRGRFQSEIDGTSRKKPRPTSYDELGARPGRSRIESMVNLGGGSSNASASDLLMRDSLDGSAVRQTLIVREEGKPPTHFQLGNCIGRGQFGSVYRALNLNTGQMVAVKRIRLEGLSEEEVKQLMREVDLVKRLSHPSIVKYEGMARDSDTLNIVLEYAENGSLGQTLKAFGKLNERLVASYVIKILEGLDYLHRSDVVHCDLKAANILTTKNGNVKLSDFGVSLNLRQMEREIKNDVAGTPNWMAPEVIELKGASTASDIWSLACTVIELLTGKPPYSDIGNGMSVMFRIVEDDMPPIPEDFSDNLKDFLKICFQKDPTNRPSAELLCEHDWLKKNWGIHKELRPQDSIPFLRRVSADLQKSEGVRHLAGIDIPRADSQTSDYPRHSEDISGSPHMQGLSGSPNIPALSGSPPHRRLSNGPGSPESDASVPREHSFVKTTFSKAVICRVCMQSVKKSAVLCETCSLIAHSRCATNAPPTCDLRAQLLQYANYSQNGAPLNAWDILATHQQFSPPTSPTGESVSDYVAPPPTAFRMFGAFRRSSSSLTPEPGPSRAPSRTSSKEDTPGQPPHVRPRQQSILRHSKESYPRPTSFSSADTTQTTANRSSLRSAATAGGSVSSRNEAVKSVVSGIDTDAPYTNSRFSAGESDVRRISEFAPSSAAGDYGSTGISGEADELSPDEKRRQKKRESKPSSNGCVLQ